MRGPEAGRSRAIAHRPEAVVRSSALVGQSLRTVGCSYEEKPNNINGRAVEYAREFGVF